MTSLRERNFPIRATTMTKPPGSPLRRSAGRMARSVRIAELSTP